MSYSDGGRLKLILLPGMDGTGELFAEFSRLLPAWIEPEIFSYPPHERFSYAQLHTRVESMLPQSESFVILAESFSSPLAVMIAARSPTNLKGVVLCAGFVESPIGGVARLLARALSPIAFAIKPPEVILRRYLVGRSASKDLLAAVAAAIAKVSPEVLTHRLRSVLDCDCRRELREVMLPVLYIGATRDRLIGKRSAEVIRNARAETEFTLVDGPHLVVQARPREVALEVIGFLGRRS